jgi:hypothetical protein
MRQTGTEVRPLAYRTAVVGNRLSTKSGDAMHLDLTGFRRRLESDLLEIDAALAQAGNAAATVVLDQSSVGRLSRKDAQS